MQLLSVLAGTWRPTIVVKQFAFVIAESGKAGFKLASDHSLINRIRSGEQEAATQLYLKYAARLQSWASSKTSSAFASRFDEEDVVQSVFRTFFRRVNEGLYNVPPGDELWQLLLVIALNKIRKLANHHRALKRDVGKTQGSDVLELAARQGMSIDDTSLQILRIVLDELFIGMTNTQQEVVQLRIEGYKTDDIAQRTGRSSRTVERVLREFRLKLNEQLNVGFQSSQ